MYLPRHYIEYDDITLQCFECALSVSSVYFVHHNYHPECFIQYLHVAQKLLPERLHQLSALHLKRYHVHNLLSPCFVDGRIPRSSQNSDQNASVILQLKWWANAIPIPRSSQNSDHNAAIVTEVMNKRNPYARFVSKQRSKCIYCNWSDAQTQYLYHVCLKTAIEMHLFQLKWWTNAIPIPHASQYSDKNASIANEVLNKRNPYTTFLKKNTGQHVQSIATEVLQGQFLLHVLNKTQVNMHLLQLKC